MLGSKAEKSMAGLGAGVSITRHMLPIGSHLLDSQSHLTLSGLDVTLITATDVPVSEPEQLPDLPW
jgi:hypothetical protein